MYVQTINRFMTNIVNLIQDILKIQSTLVQVTIDNGVF